MSDTLNYDGALENAYTILRSRQTGLGDPLRDKTQSFSINTDLRLLDPAERIALFRQSKLAKKVVTLYPIDAARGWVDFVLGTAKIEGYKLSQYFDDFRTGSLKEAFVETSIEARLHGDSYLLLGIDDGQNWDQPINEKTIKTFRWVEPLYWNEVTPDGTYYGRKPEYYWVSLLNRNLDVPQMQMKVHRSRLLRFYGEKLYGSSQQYNAGKNDSVLQPMYAAFASFFQGLMSSSAMLADYNVFKYKLKGLRQLIQQGQQDAILQRFLTLQLGMSTVKGLAVDAEFEDADFISRSYGGVKDIINVLMDVLVANTDYPRSKLMNQSSNNGLGTQNKGESDRYEWATCVNSYQVDNWESHLKTCVRYALLSKDGVTRGILPDGYGVHFRNTLQLTPLEDAELRLIKSQENKNNTETKIIDPYEARMSGYGSPEWTSEITLDPEISERKRIEALNPTNETPELDTELSLRDNKTKDELKGDAATKKIISWKGLNIGLEFLPGDERHGRILNAMGYGHIRRHQGEDKQALDCYVNESIIDGSYKGSKITRVTQIDELGDFEYKYFLGYTVAEARKKYLEVKPSYLLSAIKAVTLKDISRFSKDATEGLSDKEFNEIADIEPLTTVENILKETS